MKATHKYTGINPETGRIWDEESIQRAERDRLSFRVPDEPEQQPTKQAPRNCEGVG